MSKVDAMRALREARYAAAAKSGGPAPARTPAKPTATRKPAAEPATTAQTEAPTEARCGHRNMGGRSCTRELDHVKNGTQHHRDG